MKIHFFFLSAGAAPIFPFLSTILKQRGYSSIIVGLIFTILSFIGLLVRPVIGAITDKYKCRRAAFILSIAIMSVFISILMFIPGSDEQTEINDTDVIKSPLFWLFLSTITIFKISAVVAIVMEDTICVQLLDKDKTKYGNQRMWGAIGWGTMSIVSGVCVDWFSKGLEYKNYTPGFIISLICSFLDMYVVSTIKNVQTTEIKTGPSNVQKVLTKIRVLSFLFWVVIYGMLLSFLWYFQFLYMEDISNIYHPETKPYIKTIQGLSLTIQCFGGEVPFFFLSNFILKRVGHMNVFSLMFFAFAVRFYLYSIITNPVCVLPVELLNGITYALAYSAVISYAAELAPVGAEGTLQGIVGMAMEGIGVPIGSFIGGYLFNRFGSISSFNIFSYIALAVCVIQTISNQLITRFSKNDILKEEVSN
ncbi:major facilitator superfamily domain-containing protein 6-like isoform X3 [Metopolophium dirhodum]|nr:major facilitator superfamily domain-containing protein 6-like isoform X3 [Metopolophium dirhodum]